MKHDTIVLVGMMGAGKTTLGRLLAERLGRRFLDVDERIEAQSGMRIADIFAVHGEREFRRREFAALRDLVADPEPAVLAAGGGAFCQGDVRAFLRDNARSVFIRVAEDELLRRLEQAGVDKRPLLASPNWRGRVRELVGARYPLYETAEIVLDVGDEEPAATADRLAAILAATESIMGENDAHG